MTKIFLDNKYLVVGGSPSSFFLRTLEFCFGAGAALPGSSVFLWFFDKVSLGTCVLSCVQLFATLKGCC